MRKMVDINTKDQKSVMEKIKSETDFMYSLQSGDKELLRPFLYHASTSGKNIRHKLIEVLNYWMDVPKDKIVKITEVVDNLHNITLLIDDIQDYTRLRRGLPAAHTIFGITNVANACSFHERGITEMVMQLSHPKALRVYQDAFLELCRGQGIELYWRDNVVCPTENEYAQMILKKTGGLFFLAYNFMQLFARKRVELDRLLTAMSLYFQINDDYLNLTSDLYFRNKGFCEDLTEGKFGFPTLHAVNSNPEIGKEIKNILETRPTDVEKKKHCLSLIEKCGSFEYTRNRLKKLKAAIFKELNKFEENPFLKEFLSKLMPTST